MVEEAPEKKEAGELEEAVYHFQLLRRAYAEARYEPRPAVNILNINGYRNEDVNFCIFHNQSFSCVRIYSMKHRYVLMGEF